MRFSWVIAVLVTLAGGTRAWALAPDELLLLVNSTNPASQKCAEFYQKARLVPDGRILALELPNNDDISFDKYERDVVPPIRAFLRRNGLATKVKCIVTFYGVPLRIGARVKTPADEKEIAAIRDLLDQTYVKTEPVVAEAEALAKQLNPTFVPEAKPGSADLLLPRSNKAISTILAALPKTVDVRDQQHKQHLVSLVGLLSSLVGDSEVIRNFPDSELKKILSQPQAQHWATRRHELEHIASEVQTLQGQRYDAEARQRLRDTVADAFGLFGLINLLKHQEEYLLTDNTVSAFDNELSLLWLDYYPRASALPNALNWRYRASPNRPPTLMTARLDGPRESIVPNIVLMSLKAERDGLQGRIAIDATGGTNTAGGFDKTGGYKAFDQHLINLSNMVRAHANLPLTFDNKFPVFQPGTVKDVALYCGWYSVRNYVPAFSFKPGAVGYHVASLEAISLRMEGERGWCAGLLNDGISVTMGAVAEPYLDAFPLPDEFFPFLMTGKATLAEVYWNTLPHVSWMITMIGDPLYTPFKNNPQMRVEDLPEGMQIMFAPTVQVPQSSSGVSPPDPAAPRTRPAP